jgi:hypothetical protein
MAQPMFEAAGYPPDRPRRVFGDEFNEAHRQDLSNYTHSVSKTT